MPHRKKAKPGFKEQQKINRAASLKRIEARKQKALESRFGTTIRLDPLNVTTTPATVRAVEQRKRKRRRRPRGL